MRLADKPPPEDTAMDGIAKPFCMVASWRTSLESQWLQIALKTYFWAGVLFACVFAVSLTCLAATKYYHDQTVLQHNAMERDFRSYSSDLAKARETAREVEKSVRDVGKAWYAVDEMRKKIEQDVAELKAGK